MRTKPVNPQNSYHHSLPHQELELGGNPLPLPPPKPTSRRKLVIIVGLIIAILVVAAIVYFVVNRTPKIPCLTRTDYTELTGEKLTKDTPFTPSVDFYGYDIEYTAGSTDYTEPAITIEQLQKIGQFLAAHKQVDIIVNLQTFTAEGSAETLATARLATIRTTLTDAGADKDSIKLIRKTIPNDPNDDVESYNTVTLGITTAQACE